MKKQCLVLLSLLAYSFPATAMLKAAVRSCTRRINNPHKALETLDATLEAIQKISNVSAKTTLGAIAGGSCGIFAARQASEIYSVQNKERLTRHSFNGGMLGGAALAGGAPGVACVALAIAVVEYNCEEEKNIALLTR